MTQRAIVVGGGIGGLAAALTLRATGTKPSVFERDPAGSDRLTAGTGITLWSNATRVLAELGLHDELLAAGSALETFENRTSRGRKIADWPIGDMGRRIGVPSISIRRSELHRVLRHAVGDDLTFDAEYAGVSEQAGGITARFVQGGVVRGDVEGDFLVGADGLRSRVRDSVLPASDPRFAGYVVYRAIVTQPSPVPAHVFVQMWGRGTRFGYYQVGRGETYWFAVVNAAKDDAPDPTDHKSELLARFGGWAGPVAELITRSDDAAVSRARIFDRDPVRTWGSGRVTLLGDAVHPMTFNVGQGACQAIEDAAALAREVRVGGDAQSALRCYEAQRQVDQGSGAARAPHR